MGMDHKEKYCLRKLLKTRKNERRKNNKNEKNWRGETQMEKWIARGSASSFVAHWLSVAGDCGLNPEGGEKIVFEFDLMIAAYLRINS